ncbi:unnamed protein product [Peronospora belbahrii]|uniref:Uncharacterized protein n=1 Tax=Peronospora belbahrii TaxID=622444 RepID=A0AAU9KLI7_9STRA|nr:unnamed protein product [Peronospora belbahrii]CAH0518610.1 unnamed protein product [Peronospora belbahrii]
MHVIHTLVLQRPPVSRDRHATETFQCGGSTVKAYDMSMLSTNTATDSSQPTVHARAAPPGASMTDEGKEERGLVDKVKSLVSGFRKSTSEKVEIDTADVNRVQEKQEAATSMLEAGGGMK